MVRYYEPSISPVGLHESKRKLKTIVMHRYIIYMFIVPVLRVQQPCKYDHDYHVRGEVEKV